MLYPPPHAIQVMRGAIDWVHLIGFPLFLLRFLFYTSASFLYLCSQCSQCSDTHLLLYTLFCFLLIHQAILLTISETDQCKGRGLNIDADVRSLPCPTIGWLRPVAKSMARFVRLSNHHLSDIENHVVDHH